MTFAVGEILQLGERVLTQITRGVGAVEVVAGIIHGLTGRNKQDAVVELVKQSLEVAETYAGRDLANDADVLTAARAVVDAVVALYNVIARKTGRTV